MATKYGDVTTWDMLMMPPILLRTIFSVLVNLLTSPVRGERGATSIAKHAIYAGIRTAMSLTNSRQQHWSNPPSDKAYEICAKEKGFQPESILLSDGSKGHWIGKKDAKKVILYFHGGGYTLAASPSHVEYMWQLQDSLNKNGHDTAILMLSYTVVPYARYPVQLKQAVELLRYLVQIEKRSPSDIIIGGDSAGGNLALGILSHLLHPHPSIPKLDLRGPLAGAILISPWVSFRTDFKSFKTNANSDMICPEMLHPWASEFLGSSKPDEYSEPYLASAEWWNRLEGSVKEILIWGGGGEVLIDPIKAVAAKIEGAHKKTTTIVTPREAHEEMIIGVMVGEKGEKRGASARAIESWASARL